MIRRRQTSASRSKPRTARAKYDCLDVLTGDEAQAVLNELLSSRLDLMSDARRVANVLLATVSFADVAAGVFGALQALDLDDLDAGPRPGGYVEPSEAAWNVIERVVTPYFHDLERRVKPWRSGAAAAATAHSHATSSRSTRPTGHGSFADRNWPRLYF